MTVLHAADWHQRKSLKHIISLLDGRNGATRYVGGVVRDALLGAEAKDIDLATKLLPEDVMARLKDASITVIPTGIEHGTVTAVTEEGPIEITTLRRDVSTDGRRATVAFSDDWREDAARRDFTINALFADPETLEVFDYFGGLEDLEKRRIRFIGSAKDRISEDHLRIMRYFRFIARIGDHAVDEEAYLACRKARRELTKLSRERVSEELMKLLSADDPVYAIEEMIDGDIFEHILPEIDDDAMLILSPLMGREKDHGIAPDPIRRLVALLPKDMAKADAIAKNLRMSKKIRKAIAARLVEETPTTETIRSLAYYNTPQAARDCALLFGADQDVALMLTKLDRWQSPSLPITGGDLIAMGVEAGPMVSDVLAIVERKWVEEKFPDETRVHDIANHIISTL